MIREIFTAISWVYGILAVLYLNLFGCLTPHVGYAPSPGWYFSNRALAARPPEHLWATDTALYSNLAAVDQWHLLIFCEPHEHTTIYHAELQVLLLATHLALPHTVIFIDNTVVLGTLQWSHCLSRDLIELTFLIAFKDICLLHQVSLESSGLSHLHSSSSYSRGWPITVDYV